MNEDQQEHYKKLQEAQKDAAEYANKILDVTNEYQEVCDKIRDDTEQILENEHEMEDIAIDLFQTATKTVDTLKDLNESKGWLQGLFTNRESDSPFRALVEDLNLLEGLFGTTTTNANLFFKTMIDGATDAASKQF
jgi:chromosome segregation ATPase